MNTLYAGKSCTSSPILNSISWLTDRVVSIRISLPNRTDPLNRDSVTRTSVGARASPLLFTTRAIRSGDSCRGVGPIIHTVMLMRPTQLAASGTTRSTRATLGASDLWVSTFQALSPLITSQTGQQEAILLGIPQPIPSTKCANVYRTNFSIKPYCSIYNLKSENLSALYSYKLGFVL